MASSAAVAGWTAVIKELQRWHVHPPTSEQEDRLVRRINKLLDQLDSLPAPALKALVQDAQMTHQLAEQCRLTFQLNAGGRVKGIVVSSFAAWLCQTVQGPQFPGAASVRQQLQESGLLQRMTAMLTAAADDLAAAAAALVITAEAGATNSSSHSSARTAVVAKSVVKQRLRDASNLLSIRIRACQQLSVATPDSMEVVLSSAAAAVRLALCIYQTCSRLRAPCVQQLLEGDSTFQDVSAMALRDAHSSTLNTAMCLSGDNPWPCAPAPRGSGAPAGPQAEAVPAPSGGRELLLCPELVPALAISVLVTVLGLDTGDGLSSGPGSSGGSDAAGSAGAGSSGSGNGSSSGSSSTAGRGPPAQGTSRQQRRQQQRQQRRTGSSAAAPQQQPASTGSNRGLSSAVRSLDSLTPLSSGLFGLLGVSREVLLQAAGALASANRRTHVADMCDITDAYSNVLDHQVRKALHNGPYTAQQLQQFEADMLLSLAVRQLAASMPDSYADAQAARTLACRLCCSPLSRLFDGSKRHRLPLSAPYTGPQLALQVLPSPLGPPAAAHGQQQQQWYAVTPTAQLLNELLPLLTSYCMSKLQKLQEQRQQVLDAVYSQLQQTAEGGSQQAAAGGNANAPSAAADRSLLSALDAASRSARPSCRSSLRQCMQLLATLLQGVCGAPAPNPSAPQLSAASLATSGGCSEGQFPYSSVLHAQDAVLQHAGGVVRVCEALLRDAAVLCEAAAQLDDGRVAAAVADEAATRQLTAAGVEAAERNLAWMASTVASMCQHQPLPTVDAYCHGPSALGLAAAAAGPGSGLKRHMYSLLCSMVKLGDAATGAVQTSMEARNHLHAAACDAAQALLAHAVCSASQHESAAEGAAEGGGRGGAVAALPSVVILGRCCSLWAAQLQSVPAEAMPGPEEPLHTEGILVLVQQWLQAASTQEQLVAAGYAPQALLQQLQQALAALQAAKFNAAYFGDNARLYTASREEAAQQLRAVGAALCSFAVPCMCNNAACRNVSGLTEVGLVSGRSRLCSGCRVARYCSHACQCAAWKQHKRVCAALAAASGHAAVC